MDDKIIKILKVTLVIGILNIIIGLVNLFIKIGG